ncbi:hypothetical protein BZA05DRAFT_41624 [Tricharina praecox]|uniref:uncharacterized protein n=1 Tax=Tricharina praecox TaxID=43433 RepID=UPI00222116BC|nr:uncharacterized protein BZA05DRAFT_41624 [Tricharina praecox]KAI5852315.1 hypothetical protein BZA05DRAFT_41624 [Tricharina praecox]
MPLLRLYLDVSTLTPSGFATALSLLPPAVHPSITRYHFPSDRALALGSAFLQRYVICTHYAAHTTLSSVPLHRDPANGRPYHGAVAGTGQLDGVEDYNTSHHNPRQEFPAGGERCLVAVAALVTRTPQRKRRVGVDVVPTAYTRCGAEEFVETFCGGGGTEAGVFTAMEVEWVLRASDTVERVRGVYLLWALKEAYTKAVGVGIVGELTRVEFRGLEGWHGQERWRGAEVWVDGEDESKRWYTEGEGFFLAICCEREALVEGDIEGEWKELDLETDITGPWGAA